MMPPTALGRRLPLPVLIAVFCVMWSSAFAVGKVGLGVAPPLLLLTLRFLGAGVLLVGLAWATGGLRGLGRRDLGWLAVLGVMNHSLYLGLSYMGMQTVSAGLTSIIIGAVPVATAVAAAVVLGERMTGRKALGLVLGLGGVAVVVRGKLNAGQADAAGLLLCFAALAMLTAGTLAFKRVRLGVGLLAATGVQILIGGLVLAPVALAVEDVAAVRPGFDLAWSLAWMIVGSSGAAYLAWFAILGRASASAATAWHFLMPPLGIGFAWMMLGEPVDPADLLGVVPVAVGIALVTRS